MRNINIIAACDVIGGFAKNNTIPWIEEDLAKQDLKNFQKITNGHICVMGTNTYNEIHSMRVARTGGEVEELLPGRKCYVVTSNPSKIFPGATAVGSLREVRNEQDFDSNGPIFVIGGRRLFVESIAWANNVFLTVINKNYDCDTFFPIVTLIKKFNPIAIDKQEGFSFIQYSRHTNS